VQVELDVKQAFETPLRFPPELDTIDVSKPAPEIVVLATVCDLLTTYCIVLMAETMVVPERMPVPKMVPPMVGAFVKTESVRVVPEIEPVVRTVQGLPPEVGWQKIEGVGVDR